MAEVVADRANASSNLGTRLWSLVTGHPIASVFLAALAVRLVIAVFLSSYFSGTLVFDDTTYHEMAAQKAADQTAHWDQFTHTLYWSTAAFTVPVTYLYKIFGPEAIAAQIYIALLGAATAALAALLALEILQVRWALFVGAIVAFLPSQAFWSAMLMKDAPVWIVLSCLAVLVAVGNRSTGWKLVAIGIGCALMLALLSYLRPHTLVVASWAVMIAAIAGSKLAKWPRIAGAAAIGLLVPLLVGDIGLGGLSLVTNAGALEDRRFLNAQGANTAVVDTDAAPPGSDLVPLEVQKEASGLEGEAEGAETKANDFLARAEELEASGGVTQPRAPKALARAARLRARAARLAAKAAALRTAAAQALVSAQRPIPLGDAPLDPDIAHLPRGLSVMLLEPFPLPFSGSPSLRMARAEAIFWYPVLGLALYGLWLARKHLRVLAFPLLAAGGIVVMYALSEGNVGTAHRHRGEFVWAVALLAGLGAKRLWDRRGSASS